MRFLRNVSVVSLGDEVMDSRAVPKPGTVTAAAQRLAVIGGTGRHDFRAGGARRPALPQPLHGRPGRLSRGSGSAPPRGQRPWPPWPWATAPPPGRDQGVDRRRADPRGGGADGTLHVAALFLADEGGCCGRQQALGQAGEEAPGDVARGEEGDIGARGPPTGPNGGRRRPRSSPTRATGGAGPG